MFLNIFLINSIAFSSDHHQKRANFYTLLIVLEAGLTQHKMHAAFDILALTQPYVKKYNCA